MMKLLTKNSYLYFPNVSQNSASGNGGGLYMLSSQLAVVGGELSLNAAENGGGLYHDGAQVQITNCSILYNSALSYGGGIMTTGFETPTNITLTDSLILGNEASLAGGGCAAVTGIFCLF
jgi:hypothetical protein